MFSKEKNLLKVRYLSVENVKISIKSWPEGLAGQVIYLTIVTMYQVINPKNTEICLVDHGFCLVLFPHIDLILISESESNKSLYSMTLTKDTLRYGRNT
jgi:hypothetical protein